MYRLSVGLGKSVFQPSIIFSFGKYGDVFQKIKQHRIILSERIIEYYLSCVPEDLYEPLRTYIDSIHTNDEESHSFEDNEIEDIRDFIVSCVLSTNQGILVSEKEEFEKNKICKKKAKFITPAEIHGNRQNLITLYSLPVVNFTAKPGDSCEGFTTWLRRWFTGERKIEIIDSYIFSSYGIRTLKKYYFPCMEMGSEVHIYSRITEKTEYSTKQEILEAIGPEVQNRISVSIHFIEEYHERYIILPSCQITIGKGLDFLSLSGIVKDCCTINVSAEKNYENPRECGIDVLTGNINM